MKAIIDEKLYDTETAELICAFYVTTRHPSSSSVYRHTHKLYRTKKGAYFVHDTFADTLDVSSESEVRKLLRRKDPDKYIEMFGEVEEA